jgi:hypothetical protein
MMALVKMIDSRALLLHPSILYNDSTNVHIHIQPVPPTCKHLNQPYKGFTPL